MQGLRCLVICTHQGSKSCSILPSRMGEHRVSLENIKNIENVEKMENINQMTYNTKLMLLFLTVDTLFVNQITQNTLLTVFMVTVTDG